LNKVCKKTDKILAGVTCSYKRNIGWQDRVIRTIFGVLSLAGAITSILRTSPSILGVLFMAQVVIVFSSRCPICYLYRKEFSLVISSEEMANPIIP
jgi:hypothetical protein